MGQHLPRLRQALPRPDSPRSMQQLALHRLGQIAQ